MFILKFGENILAEVLTVEKSGGGGGGGGMDASSTEFRAI